MSTQRKHRTSNDFLIGGVVGLAGAADALGGDKALKLLIDCINEAADNHKLEEKARC